MDLSEGERVEQHSASATVVEEVAVAADRVVEQIGIALFASHSGEQGESRPLPGEGRVVVRLRLDDLAQFSPDDVSHWLPALRAAIERHAVEIGLSAGQGYVLGNHRWLHGRRAFIT